MNSIDEAKAYALRVTTRYFSEEEAKQTLSDYKRYLAFADEDDRLFWEDQVTRLAEWIDSDAFRLGNYPQGLDELMLDLVEWRSVIYAYQNTQLKSNLFTSSIFSQWNSGAIYAIACIIGKLCSKHRQDNSLVNTWKKTSSFIVKDGACSQDEADFITKALHPKEGFFAKSKTILFRNKSIAHNESSPRLDWSDVDRDIEILSRIWAIIVAFCSSGVLSPFSKDAPFYGLENLISGTELLQLKKLRMEYIEKFKLWSRKNLLNGNLDPQSRALAEVVLESAPPFTASKEAG